MASCTSSASSASSAQTSSSAPEEPVLSHAAEVNRKTKPSRNPSRITDLDDLPQPNGSNMSVPDLALEALYAAISGAPFADLEFIVEHPQGQQSIWASSAILKKACPELMKDVNERGELELDAMESLATSASSAARRPRARARAASERLTATAAPGAPSAQTNLSRRFAEPRPSMGHLDSFSSPSELEHPREQEEEEGFDDAAEFNAEEAEAGRNDASLTRAGHSSLSVIPRERELASKSADEATPQAGGAINTNRFAKFVKFMNTERPKTDKSLAPALPVKDDSPRQRIRSYSSFAELEKPVRSRAPAPHQVHVSGCTPATMQGLIFYLYTNQIAFTRQKSDSTEGGKDSSGEAGDGRKSTSWPPVVSSKAIYCLAKQLHLRDLQSRSFKHVCATLSAATVLSDLLSHFSDRFPEVQDAQLEFISAHWNRIKSQPDLSSTLQLLVACKFPKAHAGLLQLWTRMEFGSQ